MPDFPVLLRVAQKRCVVVGGGPVALRRTKALHDAGAHVTVIAPDIDPGLEVIEGITVVQRPYQPGDLAGAILVIVATDDPTVNSAVARDAKREGVLVNRADEPAKGDLTVLAHAHHGPITLAVHTGGASASAAAAIRRQLSQALDPDWQRLLTIIAPYRAKIQQAVADPLERRTRLAQLTSDQAMGILKDAGPEALRKYCDQLVKPPPTR